MAKLTKNALLRAVAGLSEEERGRLLRALSNGMLDNTLPDNPQAIAELGLTLIAGKPVNLSKRTKAAKPKIRRGVGSY